MQGNESNVTNAHMCLIQADKFLQAHQWSEANKKYVEASKIFQAAVLATDDPQAKRSFEAMVVHCTEKAQLIQSYLMSNSIDLSDTANFSDEDPIARDEDSQIYLDDYYNQSNVFQQRIVFGGSTIEEEVIDLYLRPLEDADKARNSGTGKTEEKNSNWWGVGNIFRNLLRSPSGTNKNEQKNTNEQLSNDSTLDTSFYVMADEARKRMLKHGKNTPPSTTPAENTQKSNNNTPMRKSNDSISIPDEKKTKQDLLDELKKLRKTVQILSQQNAILLSSTTTPVMHGLIHENTQLRRSIIMMHHRSKKPKAEGDAQNLSMIQEAKGAPQTAPVTPVKIQITSTEKKPHLTVHNANTNVHSQSNDAKIKELEEKLASMTNEIKEKDDELLKYKKRWKVLKTSAKQRQKSAEHNGSNFSLTNESFKRASNEL
jgi:hypothetical protein